MRQVRSPKSKVRIGSTAILTVALTLAFLPAPVPAPGQQPGKVYRIGYLGGPGPAPTEATPQHCPIQGAPNWRAFVEGLREYGYLPGQNLLIECRWTEGQEERAPALAAELVSLTPDLIVAGNAAANVRAAQQATSTIPIVLVNITDPVGSGLVTSLAHPGGNLTGLAETAGLEIAGKRLQLLKEAVPTLSRVAVLRFTTDLASPYGNYWTETQAAARALGLTLQSVGAQDPKELEGAFTAMTKGRAEALLVLPSPLTYIHAQRIVELAARSRLPAMYPFGHLVEVGGLLSYEASRLDMYRRLGFYVDKIFHGANPGDLPVEQPTKFELVINLKTAKALGLTIPPSLLNRADEVIQ